ncbi:NepR family anti-sigma factor [Sphingomonadaceae bacterium jetA1]|uniref:NepR family anti-sigma factor n=1 Tax=Facivitalis istanbulensis TaxID=3075838 RepID=UPI003470FB1C
MHPGTNQIEFGFIATSTMALAFRRPAALQGRHCVGCPASWVMQGDILSLGNKTTKTPSSPPSSGGQKDAGAVLRQAYQKTVDEKIPDEMLDLLSKLD